MKVLDSYITDRAALYNGDSAEVMEGLKSELFNLECKVNDYNPTQEMRLPNFL